MSNLKSILNVALSASNQAADFVKSIRSSGELSLKYKRPRDIVTAADLGSNEIIIKAIQEAFPDHRFLSEESNPNEQDLTGKLWIIDPVDGTTNFARGHHHVGISLAYAEDGVVKVAVVNAPFLGEIYTAIKGEGAFRNQERIQVSNQEDLLNSLVGTGFPYLREDLDSILDKLKIVITNCQDLRRLGACSLDLCWVACGRLDIYYEDVQPWDMAAGALIVKEAGGKVGTTNNKLKNSKIPDDLYAKGLLATNQHLYQKISAILNT